LVGSLLAIVFAALFFLICYIGLQDKLPKYQSLSVVL